MPIFLLFVLPIIFSISKEMDVVLKTCHEIAHLLFCEQLLVFMEAAASLSRFVKEVFASVYYVLDSLLDYGVVDSILGA